jgi:hypothetical protein
MLNIGLNKPLSRLPCCYIFVSRLSSLETTINHSNLTGLEIVVVSTDYVVDAQDLPGNDVLSPRTAVIMDEVVKTDKVVTVARPKLYWHV